MRPYELQPSLAWVLVRAVGNAVNLGLFGTFTTVALIFSSWWLFIIGLFSCVTFTTLTLSCPTVRHLVDGEVRMLRLSDCQDVSDPMLRHMVTAFHAGRSEIDAILSRMPKELRMSLGTAIATLDELECFAAQLVLRAQELASLLQLVGESTLEDEVEHLSENLKCKESEGAKREYDSILKLKREHQLLLDEVSEIREHMFISLMRAVVIVKALPMRLIGLRVVEGQTTDMVSADLDEVWTRIQGELQSSEQAIKGLKALMPAE